MSRFSSLLTLHHRRTALRGGAVRLALARLHVLAQRFRLVTVGVAVGLGTIAMLSVSAANERADALAASLGTTSPWPVAVADLDPGHVLSSSDVEWREIPERFSPLDEAPLSLAGAQLLVPVGAGELITSARLALREGTAALLPPGHRGVAMPAEAVRLELRVGDRVDLIASPAYAEFAVLADGIVASGVVVISISEQAVVLAVPASDAVTAAESIERGGAALVLSAPD